MLDALLVTVTVLSLVLAGVMGVVSWRVLLLDRRRSDVRVASLRAAMEPQVEATLELQGDATELKTALQVGVDF